jgi:hypothetical protein
MAPPFVFPSTLRDLERDADGDDDGEPSLRPEAPIAVTTLRAADLEEFVKGTRPLHLPLPSNPPQNSEFQLELPGIERSMDDGGARRSRAARFASELWL